MNTRGYSGANYHEIQPYGEGRANAYYSAAAGYADHVCRPVVVDAEGRKNPIIRYTTPAYNSEGYILQAETVVEHVTTRAPVISIVRSTDQYRYGNSYGYDQPEVEEVYKEYGVDKQYAKPGSTYGYDPSPVKNFLNKVQTDVTIQQPQPAAKVSGQFNSNWWARPIPTTTTTRQDNGSSAINGTTKYGNDDNRVLETVHHQKKIFNVPIVGDKQMDPAVNNNIHTNNKFNFHERPNYEAGPVLPSATRPGLLSRPTNDVNDAVEFLTEGVRTIQSSDVVSRPPNKAGNLGGISPWRGVPRTDSLSSDSDDLEKGKEQKAYGGMENFQKYNQGAAARNPINDYEKAEANRGTSTLFRQPATSFPAAISQPQLQPRFTAVPPPPAQPREVMNYYSDQSETIDSSEARKRYGKLKPQAVVPENIAHGSAVTINSDDLIKKYNGAKVPW